MIISEYAIGARILSITRYSKECYLSRRRCRCVHCGNLIERGDIGLWCVPNTKVAYVHYSCFEEFIKEKKKELDVVFEYIQKSRDNVIITNKVLNNVTEIDQRREEVVLYDQ